jgi:hypothetical protein
VSGDVRLGRVGGRVCVNSVSGDVEIAEAARGVDAKTVSGDQSYGSIAEGEAQLGRQRRRQDRPRRLS